MYNLEKEIKKLDKIYDVSNQEKYILELLNKYDFNRRIIILNYFINNKEDEYNRLFKIKKYFIKKGKKKKVRDISIKLIEIKLLVDKLKVIKKNLVKNNKNVVKLLLSKEQIENIDLVINKKTYELIVELNNSKSSSQKLEIANELKEIYKEGMEVIKDEQEMDEYIQLIKIMLKYINDNITVENKKQNKKTKKDDLFLKDNEISNHQKTIVNAMKNGSDISCYNIKDILIAYREFIIHFTSTHPINVLKYAKYISNVLLSDVVSIDNIIVLISSIKDCIKYRLLSLDKNDPEQEKERKTLKEIRIVFDFISKNYREDINKTKHNYCYDVLKYFMQTEEGYPYIKKIVNNLPNMVNIRNDSEHIIITILKEFIYNHKKMLKDKSCSYINPDYLKQVYILFSHSPYLRLTKEERVEINKIINNYLEYLKDNVFKFDRQKEIKKEISALKTNNYFITKAPKLKNVDKSQLVWQANKILDNRNNALIRHNRKNIENTICFNDITAYNLEETEDNRILKIHTLDMATMIVENTSVDSQVYNDMIEKNKIHPQISKHLEFEYEKYNPVITYEIEFDKNNNVSNFKIYRSNIKPTKVDDRNLYFGDNEVLNKISGLSNKILSLNNIKFDYICIPNIEKAMSFILNQEFIKYIKENDIPFIYSGVEVINDYINNMNNLNNIFSRLEQKEFRELYQLINDSVGEFCYSKDEFETEDGYNLYLINEINYLAIFNQRLIVDIIINNEEIKSKEKYINEVENLEHNLNLSIDHIKIDDMKFKNKRKRNKLKEYNY